jgi:hypothetical protein
VSTPRSIATTPRSTVTASSSSSGAARKAGDYKNLVSDVSLPPFRLLMVTKFIEACAGGKEISEGHETGIKEHAIGMEEELYNLADCDTTKEVSNSW